MDQLSQLKEDFEWFRDACVKLRNLTNTYRELYESGDETQQLLRNSAGLFFDDLNQWLLEAYYLQAGRITDPAESMGNPNLTVEQITQQLQQLGIITHEIQVLSKNLKDYRKKIKEARNKIIAHADLGNIQAPKLLGTHTEEDAQSFLSNLNNFTDEVGIALGIGPLDYSMQAGSGDVIDLLCLLRDCQKEQRINSND